VSLPVWIAIAVAVLALVVLAWVALSLLGRVKPLVRAAAGLQARTLQAQQLQAKLEALQPQLAELSARSQQVSARLPGH
jgi:hypothetical protein